MLAYNPNKTSEVKINGFVSVILYTGFIFTTLCLSAIALGVDIREAMSSFPVIEDTVTVQNDTP
jgi:hypothetical protein